MVNTPGVIIPSSYSSEEELKKDLKRRGEAAGFTRFNPSDFSENSVEQSTPSEEFLEHFGVKGMRWGQRHQRPGPSKDSKRATQIRKKGDLGTKKALTNKEIEEFNRRINLEQKYSKLTPSKRKITTTHVIALAASVNAAIAFASTPFGKAIAKNIKSKMEWH